MLRVKQKEGNVRSEDSGEESFNEKDASKNLTTEQRIMKFKKLLFTSGLLERIETARLDIGGKEASRKFELYPRLKYDPGSDSDQFLKEPTYLHTQYYVRHSETYSSFCINVKEGGIYCERRNKKDQINVVSVSDPEIREWFAFLEKK